MAFMQSVTDYARIRHVVTNEALLACLTMDELFDGSSYYRCALAPDERHPLYPEPPKAKQFEVEHGIIRETVLVRTMDETGWKYHRMILAHSKYTHETEEFFTYKTAARWLFLIADVHLSRKKRKGEKYVAPIAIPQITGLGQLQQLIQNVTQPQPPEQRV